MCFLFLFFLFFSPRSSTSETLSEGEDAHGMNGVDGLAVTRRSGGASKSSTTHLLHVFAPGVNGHAHNNARLCIDVYSIPVCVERGQRTESRICLSFRRVFFRSVDEKEKEREIVREREKESTASGW